MCRDFTRSWSIAMPNTAPAYTFNGITRPALNFDNAGNIILDPAAASFVAAYGHQGAVSRGLPANTPIRRCLPTLTTPLDVNGAANSVAEGAAVNTPVGLTAPGHQYRRAPVTYALTAENSGGAFKIDATTGVVTVANGGLLDYESSTGHTITVQATSGASPPRRASRSVSATSTTSRRSSPRAPRARPRTSRPPRRSIPPTPPTPTAPRPTTP